MWSAIRWIVLRFAAIRWLFKLGWLGLSFPSSLLLKTIGLPLLAVLSIVAIPLLFCCSCSAFRFSSCWFSPASSWARSASW